MGIDVDKKIAEIERASRVYGHEWYHEDIWWLINQLKECRGENERLEKARVKLCITWPVPDQQSIEQRTKEKCKKAARNYLIDKELADSDSWSYEELEQAIDSVGEAYRGD